MKQTPIPKQASVNSSKKQDTNKNNKNKNNNNTNNTKNTKNKNNNENNKNNTKSSSQKNKSTPAIQATSVQQKKHPPTKFFELLEREGLINGGKKQEEDDEMELKSLKKKLNIKGNKLSSEFRADGLDCILIIFSFLFVK